MFELMSKVVPMLPYPRLFLCHIVVSGILQSDWVARVDTEPISCDQTVHPAQCCITVSPGRLPPHHVMCDVIISI